jgi:maltooligosyltrehalose trehalohydrolase
LSVEYDEEARWLVMRRGPITVACKWGDDVVKLAVDANVEMAVANVHATARDGVLRLAPDTVAVLRTPG